MPGPDSEPDQTLDLSGLRCPLPVLRTKKALAGIDDGGLLKVLTTDPGSAKDIPAFAQLAGVELVASGPTGSGHWFVLRK